MKPSPPSQPKFNPFQKFIGFMVPNWLARREEISSGAKLCYGRLAQFSGRDGNCHPSERTLAHELGVSERTCRRFLAELKNQRFIAVHRVGLGRSNRYEFLEHEWMADFRADKVDRPERSELSSPKQTKLSTPLGKESSKENPMEETPYSPLLGDSECASIVAILPHQVEQVYTLYPKKVGRTMALRWISKAIRKFGFEHVMTRTREYAQVVRDSDQRFVPFPTKFFREERFNDAPDTWAPRKVTLSNPQVVRPENYAGGETQI
jgi:hypothetical protein